jgi:ribosomal protein S18 acetylase RimI-like enzyme
VATPKAEQTLRRATREDSTLLGEILADAFAEDPVFAWLIDPNLKHRDQRMRTFFTSMARTYLRQKKPCYVAGDGSAAAMWAAPGKWAFPISEMAIEAAPQTAAFGRRLQRALRTQLQVESHHPKDPKHWYLGYLGARQANQGQGLGSGLLREVLTKANADGTPAYLESSNIRNVPLYERHGFKVSGEIRALGKGPTIYLMWREPA